VKIFNGKSNYYKIWNTFTLNFWRFFSLYRSAVADGVLLFGCWSRVELRIPYRRVYTESLNAIGPFETSVTRSPRKHEPGKRTKILCKSDGNNSTGKYRRLYRRKRTAEKRPRTLLYKSRIDSSGRPFGAEPQLGPKRLVSIYRAGPFRRRFSPEKRVRGSSVVNSFIRQPRGAASTQ
jgi:hypothetical protein